MTLRFNPSRIKCLVALLWLFGKRITENLKLKRKDIRVSKGYLYVHYIISKKKAQQGKPIPERRLKRMTLENPYTQYVIDYVEGIADPEAYLFPGRSRERTIKVYNKRLDKTYVYKKEAMPIMSNAHAYRILRGLDPDVWCHLFRHSVATEMAERGYTEEQLMAWFDWDRYDTAHGYVKGGPKLTEKASKRTW